LKELNSIKDCIKEEIKRVKEALLNSNDKGAVKFFLDSINEDIKEMINTGFSYKQQLNIINRSSGKDIKYNTYIRYVKKNLYKNQNRLNVCQPEIKERRVGFSHEALPDVDELY